MVINEYNYGILNSIRREKGGPTTDIFDPQEWVELHPQVGSVSFKWIGSPDINWPRHQPW